MNFADVINKISADLNFVDVGINEMSIVLKFVDAIIRSNVLTYKVFIIKRRSIRQGHGNKTGFVLNYTALYLKANQTSILKLKRSSSQTLTFPFRQVENV